MNINPFKKKAKPLNIAKAHQEIDALEKQVEALQTKTASPIASTTVQPITQPTIPKVSVRDLPPIKGFEPRETKKATVEKSKAQLFQESYIEKYNERVEARANEKANAIRQEKLALSTLVSPTSPIPSFHVVKHGYYLGYDPVEGCYLISEKYPSTVFTVTAKRKASPEEVFKRVSLSNYSTDKSNPAPHESNKDEFAKLTKAEFDSMVAAAPSWASINAAYQVGVKSADPIQWCADGSVYRNDVLKRLNLSRATVVWN